MNVLSFFQEYLNECTFHKSQQEQQHRLNNIGLKILRKEILIISFKQQQIQSSRVNAKGCSLRLCLHTSPAPLDFSLPFSIFSKRMRVSFFVAMWTKTGNFAQPCAFRRGIWIQLMVVVFEWLIDCLLCLYCLLEDHHDWIGENPSSFFHCTYGEEGGGG